MDPAQFSPKDPTDFNNSLIDIDELVEAEKTDRKSATDMIGMQSTKGFILGVSPRPNSSSKEGVYLGCFRKNCKTEWYKVG